MKEAAAAKADITLASGTSKISDFCVGELDFTNSYGNAKFTNINTSKNTLPESAAYDQFNVTMSSGDVDINGLISNSIDISNSYGDITCEEITGKDLELDLSSGSTVLRKADLESIEAKNSYGDVILGLVGASSDYSLDLNTSYGDIKVADKSYEEHLNVDNDGTRKITADLSSGDVEVNFVN